MNQPGPYIMYTTVDANGYLKNGSGKAVAVGDGVPNGSSGS